MGFDKFWHSVLITYLLAIFSLLYVCRWTVQNLVLAASFMYDLTNKYMYIVYKTALQQLEK